jgi:adenine-specific DNA-methyltransferase
VKKLTADDPETKSPDLVTENLERLKALFPELVTEGPDGAAVNVDVLKALVGDKTVTDAEEKYGLNWHGKRRARQLALTPSTGTLRPCPEDSVDWDTTQNLMIEGDNLEVLKLLQKSYAGKVKLIYIDPPYNTGKDFVYPDNFRDSIKNYLERTGRVEGGRKISSNTETSGRFHTDWLNMMYPRLKLARSLLHDEGVVCISIDDGEKHNLRSLCNDVFGEENFVGTVTWEKRTKAQNTETARNMLQSKTEYILIYKKNLDRVRFALRLSGAKEYKEMDHRGRYRIKPVEMMSARGMRGRPTMRFEILGVTPREGQQWKYGKEFINRFIERDDLVLIDGAPHIKMRPSDEDENTFLPFWSHFFPKDVGTAETGKSQLDSLLQTKAHGFETVKPVELLKALVFHVTATGDVQSAENDIVLDFFAGSGTTAQAVLEMNVEDRRARRWILVQLSEPCSEESETFQAGFATIAELTKERLRRAAKKIKSENPLFAGDLGFRVFKLDSSNIRAWEPDRDNLDQTLLDHAEHLKEGCTELDILYELLLKLGLDLCVPIETKTIAGKAVHSIGGGVLLACLAPQITRDEVEPLAQGIVAWHQALAPAGDTTCVFRDSAFADDVAKTNLAAILNQHGLTTVRSL